jgi:hypothetical protein
MQVMQMWAKFWIYWLLLVILIRVQFLVLGGQMVSGQPLINGRALAKMITIGGSELQLQRLM